MSFLPDLTMAIQRVPQTVRGTRTQATPISSPGRRAPRNLTGTCRRARRALANLPLAATLAAVSIFLPATFAHASTDTVTTLRDTGAGSLRATVAAASSGDTIDFQSGLTGTITLRSTLTITQNIAIQGPGATKLTLSGNNAVALLAIGGTVEISGLTIANGYSQLNTGAGILNVGTLTINNCVFSGNSAGGGGGAIQSENLAGATATLTVLNSTFIANVAGRGGAGGAIENISAEPGGARAIVTNDTFFSNTAPIAAGAIENASIENGTVSGGNATLTVTNSTFVGNSAGYVGGAIENYSNTSSSAALTATNNIFSDNSTGFLGGAGILNNGASNSTTVSDNVFFNNIDQGGEEDDCAGFSCGPNQSTNPMLLPLSNYGGPTQTMLPQPGSSAICAGSLSQVAPGVTTDQRGFPLNSSCVDAGSVQTNYMLVTTTADSSDQACTLSTCSLRDGVTQANASGFGDIGFGPGVSGTITLGSSLPILTGQINIVGSGLSSITISGNSSGDVGSIFTVNSDAELALNALTIAQGTAPNGGGIYNNGGSVTVANSTLTGNFAQGARNGGGGIFNASGTLTVTNSTFAANSSLGNGGAILNNSGGTATVADSTFFGNFATGVGAGVANSGTVMVTNSIFSTNSGSTLGAAISNSTTANSSGNVFYNNTDTAGSEDDCNSCTSNVQSTSANPMLTPLGNYGGLTQTMLPAPGSSAICAASSALVPLGFTTDERGFSRATSYLVNGTSTACVDAGAVQTNYQSVQFSSASYSGATGSAVTPGPVVSVTENNQNIGGIPITLGFSGAANTVTGLGPVTTVDGSGAAFNSLVGTIAGTYDLTISLSITASGNAIQPAALPASATLVLSEGGQTISFAPLSNQPLGINPFLISATASSGLPVSFASTTGSVCSVNGVSVTLLAVGTCTIRATQAGNTNVPAATPVSQSFQVTDPVPTLTWTTPAAITYGVPLSATQLNASATGLNSTKLSGSIVYTPTAGTYLTPGQQTLQAVFTPAASAAYATQTGSVTLTVNKASSSLSAPASQVQDAGSSADWILVTVTGQYAGTGIAIPGGTVTYTIGTGTMQTASISNGLATLTVPDTQSPGTYTVTVNYSGDTNYSAAPALTFQLQVGQVQPTIAWTQPPPIVYGTALGTVLNAAATYNSSSVMGTYAYTATPTGGVATPVTAASILTSSSYTLNVTFTPDHGTKYQSATASVPLTVGKATPVVDLASSSNPVLVQNATTFTAAVSAPRGTPTGTVSFFDGATPLGTATLTANGLAALTTSALAMGPHSITASYSGDSNFLAFTSAAMPQSIVDFTITVPVPAATEPPGTPASFTFTVTPVDATVLPSSVALSVSGLPSGATYTFSPATLASGLGATQGTLTVQIPQGSGITQLASLGSATGAALPTNPHDGSMQSSARRLAPIAVAFLLLPFTRRMRRTRKHLGRCASILFLLAIAITTSMGLTGCGTVRTDLGQQQSYTLTITGTSAALSHSATVTVEIQ